MLNGPGWYSDERKAELASKHHVMQRRGSLACRGCEARQLVGPAQPPRGEDGGRRADAAWVYIATAASRSPSAAPLSFLPCLCSRSRSEMVSRARRRDSDRRLCGTSELESLELESEPRRVAQRASPIEALRGSARSPPGPRAFSSASRRDSVQSRRV